MAVPELGDFLPGKMLAVALLAFASILLLSNLVTSLSTFFLAKDLDMLMAAPVDWLRLYLAKLGETIVHSSWPSMSPSRARLTITSCLFHSSIVSANDALGAIETSAPPDSSARASAAARCSLGSTSRAFMPIPPR